MTQCAEINGTVVSMNTMFRVFDRKGRGFQFRCGEISKGRVLLSFQNCYPFSFQGSPHDAARALLALGKWNFCTVAPPDLGGAGWEIFEVSPNRVCVYDDPVKKPQDSRVVPWSSTSPEEQELQPMTEGGTILLVQKEGFEDRYVSVVPYPSKRIPWQGGRIDEPWLIVGSLRQICEESMKDFDSFRPVRLFWSTKGRIYHE